MNHQAAQTTDRAPGETLPAGALDDDLSRTVYPILGVPIDAVDMAATVRKIEAAAAAKTPFLISTVNLNFLVASQDDEDFRASLLSSDLCVADGMPLLWIARLLGIPLKHRLTGSDVFEALKRPADEKAGPLSIFWFGGQEGAAEQACQRINAEAGRLTCAGALCPGFGSVEEMSSQSYIDAINASNADFLVVALGARKGQAWLRHNHARLQIPVRSHLGATINFQAGTLRRAPIAWQRLGLEWLWRIKEEPQLASRYWHDGVALLRLLATRVLPLAVFLRWNRFSHAGEGLICEHQREKSATRLIISGRMSDKDGDVLRSALRRAIEDRKAVILDLAGLRSANPLFFGMVLMLRRQLRAAELDLRIENPSGTLEREIRLGSFAPFLFPNAPNRP